MGSSSSKPKETRQILFLGLDNVGKTTILNALTHAPLTQISPTQGFNLKTVEHRNCNLKCFDLGGQKAIRQYWKFVLGIFPIHIPLCS